MNLAVISASMREGSQSRKIAQWLSEHSVSVGFEPTVLDLYDLQLPAYDDSGQTSEEIDTLLSTLEGTDAALFISPEWNGMMSAGLMNMLHFIGGRLANKPVMLVGVSAGRGGHYPLLQMRAVGYKNTHYVISPEGLLIQDCNTVMNDHDMSITASDYTVKARADYALRVLYQYAIALRGVRESGVIDRTRFDKGV